jgi:type IV pilus assembly protein PilA
MQRTLRALRDPRRQLDDGFTLIELLVVIIIIGILAAIAIPVFLHQRQKGYDASAKSDLHNAALAEESYFAAKGSYAKLSDVIGTEPISLSSGDTLVTIFLDENKGYCLGAINSKGSPPPSSQLGLGQANVVWWYDSQSGGLQPADATLSPTSYGCPGTNTASGATFENLDNISAS